MDLFIKGILGAIITIVIVLLSKSRFYYLAGLAPLFPTFALFAHFYTYQQFGTIGLRTTALFGIFSVIPYLIYLISILFLAEHLSALMTVAVALFNWVVAALLLYLAWNHFNLSKMLN